MVETDRRRDGREFGTGRLRTGPPALFQIGEGGYPAEAVRQRALRGPRGEGRVVRTRGQFRLVQQPGRDGEQEQRLRFLSRDRDQGGQPQGEARVGGVRMRDDRGPARQERLPLSETVAGGRRGQGQQAFDLVQLGRVTGVEAHHSGGGQGLQGRRGIGVGQGGGGAHQLSEGGVVRAGQRHEPADLEGGEGRGRRVVGAGAGACGQPLDGVEPAGQDRRTGRGGKQPGALAPVGVQVRGPFQHVGGSRVATAVTCSVRAAFEPGRDRRAQPGGSGGKVPGVPVGILVAEQLGQPQMRRTPLLGGGRVVDREAGERVVAAQSSPASPDESGLLGGRPHRIADVGKPGQHGVRRVVVVDGGQAHQRAARLGGQCGQTVGVDPPQPFGDRKRAVDRAGRAVVVVGGPGQFHQGEGVAPCLVEDGRPGGSGGHPRLEVQQPFRRAAVEGLQGEGRFLMGEPEQRGVPGGDKQRHRFVGQTPGDEGESVQRGAVGPLGVVHDHQQRALGG